MSKSVWDRSEWKEKIRHWARELGFVATGFTRAQMNYELESILRERQEKGLNTPFEPEDLRLRCNPQAVWPECRTVVVLAYPFPLSSPPEKNQGIIARSAVGEDYHLTVGNKLKLLSQKIMENGWESLSPRIQVDTGPLNERALAQLAGTGWLGRNQQLIVPGYGSFVAIGLLLLDQSFPSDPILTGQCGECTKCLEACPAQILGDQPFAAKKCVSYLTQSKEVLTAEQSNKLGGRLFGCDTCQEVCPYNKTRKINENVEELNITLQRGVDLMKVLNLSRSEFSTHYRPTAAGWRGKSILQRNAFLALVKARDNRLQEWLAKRGNKKDLPPILLPYLNNHKNK